MTKNLMNTKKVFSDAVDAAGYMCIGRLISFFRVSRLFYFIYFFAVDIKSLMNGIEFAY